MKNPDCGVDEAFPSWFDEYKESMVFSMGLLDRSCPEWNSLVQFVAKLGDNLLMLKQWTQDALQKRWVGKVIDEREKARRVYDRIWFALRYRVRYLTTKSNYTQLLDFTYSYKVNYDVPFFSLLHPDIPDSSLGKVNAKYLGH